MFKSIYADAMEEYYGIRSTALKASALSHELCYLKRFDRYLSEKLTDKEGISERFITDWTNTVQGKSSSVENEIVVIRQFLKYLRVLGRNVFLPTVPKVHDDYIPYLFSGEELRVIFDAADNVIQTAYNSDPYLALEFPVILRLLYGCGLRVGETLKLDLSDVDLESGVLRMVNTKGDKHRLVPMAEEMTDILQKYCMAMGLIGQYNGWLFPSSKNAGPISDRSVKHLFENILLRNGIRLENRKKHERGPCLHCLRHVFAFKSFVQAENAGRHLDDAIPYLSIYLGHVGLNETAKYLKFSNELFPESIDTFGAYMEDLISEVDYGA